MFTAFAIMQQRLPLGAKRQTMADFRQMSDLAGPISVATAPHYWWGDQCDGWHLVQAPGLSVIQERMPPATTEVRHLHRVTRQFFYVLAGELTLEIDGAVTSVPAGSGCEVAPGRPHQVLNRSRVAVEFLVVSQPPAGADRVLVPAA
jgi:mannose-6-phosphate isomerase-like protein (cupin superfamily)